MFPQYSCRHGRRLPTGVVGHEYLARKDAISVVYGVICEISVNCLVHIPGHDWLGCKILGLAANILRRDITPLRKSLPTTRHGAAASIGQAFPLGGNTFTKSSE